jgi:hypothetical protein
MALPAVPSTRSSCLKKLAVTSTSPTYPVKHPGIEWMSFRPGEAAAETIPAPGTAFENHSFGSEVLLARGEMARHASVFKAAPFWSL